MLSAGSVLAWVVLVTWQVQAKGLKSLNAACTRILWSKHQQHLHNSQVMDLMPSSYCQDRPCHIARQPCYGLSHA